MQRIYTTTNYQDAMFLASQVSGGTVSFQTDQAVTIYTITCFNCVSFHSIQVAMNALYARG